MDILIVVLLIASIFAVGYLFARNKADIQPDPVLAAEQLAEVEAQVEPEPAEEAHSAARAEEPVLELTEEVKPKKPRKPRAAKIAKAEKPKAGAKPKRKPRTKTSEQ